MLDNAELTYSSNHKKVKVSKNGKVTIAKNFIGEALITIKAKETAKYEETVKTVTVTVNPAATSIKKLKRSGKGKATVTWKKNSKVTGYQISYSKNAKFKKAKIKTVKKNKTTKLILKKLKKKSTYYVRIRTYKVVSGKKFYSVWSKKKSVKIK